MTPDDPASPSDDVHDAAPEQPAAASAPSAPATSAPATKRREVRPPFGLAGASIFLPDDHGTRHPNMRERVLLVDYAIITRRREPAGPAGKQVPAADLLEDPDVRRSKAAADNKPKKGSRQKRRQENSDLKGVPNVQAPEPKDWQVHHTHAPTPTPYGLAAQWEGGLHQRSQREALKKQALRKEHDRRAGLATGLGVGEVPRDLREDAKRNPIVRGWVRQLEEPVRDILHSVAVQQVIGGGDDDDEDADQVDETVDEEGALLDDESSEMDSDYEQILFKGRVRRFPTPLVCDVPWPPPQDQRSVILDSFGNDQTVRYRRWLAHAICAYYGLESRSVTLEETKERIVEVKTPATARLPTPRPMWELL